MRIQHNIMALNSNRQLGINNSNIAKSLEKLSSGYRINRAGDDAAGLAISEKMRAQIKGLETATDNAQDAVSLIQTAEGGLQEVHSMLNRMTELATKSANGTFDTDVDRRALQNEYNALTKEIDRIAQSTNFNGINLLDGSLNNSMTGTTAAFDGNTYDISAGKDFNGTVGFYTDEGTDPGAITVDIDAATGNVTIGLSTKDKAAVYSKNDIDAAVRSKVQSMLDGNLFAAAAVDKAKSLLSFSMGSDVTTSADLTIAKAAAVKTGAFAAAGVGQSGLTLQIGDTNAAYNQLELMISNMSSTSIGETKAGVFTSIHDAKVSDRDSAGLAVDVIKAAINQVSTQRGELGALQNRLEHTINNLGVTTENITAAESRIRDVDMAKEMMEFTKNSVLMQSAQAMLAQANQQPQSVLQLLQ